MVGKGDATKIMEFLVQRGIAFTVNTVEWIHPTTGREVYSARFTFTDFIGKQHSLTAQGGAFDWLRALWAKQANG